MTQGDGIQARPCILVVDDEPANVDILRQILKADYRTKVVTAGRAALAVACSDDPPDLILLDVLMPDMSGIEVCRALASSGVSKRIPVLFVTSRDDPTDEADGFAAGAVDYIHKPVNPHIVRARVRAHLELKGAREELQKRNEILSENLRLREEVEAINRHDLKSPLTVILNVPGFLLETERLSENAKKLLALVSESGRRMLEMVNRVVDLYKMESGTYVLRKVPVDALKVVQHIQDAQRQAMTAKNLALDVRVRGEPPAETDGFLVPAEELLVYTMFANLVVNAIDASPEGERITVSFLDGDPLTIAFHNAGAIPAAVRERFMQKFATAGKERGTGLGAYSAKLIATTLGGAIDYQTSEEAGTTITVRLPRS